MSLGCERAQVPTDKFRFADEAPTATVLYSKGVLPGWFRDLKIYKATI